MLLLFYQMLHQLAARAVITDYENGVLDDDRIQHQVNISYLVYFTYFPAW